MDTGEALTRFTIWAALVAYTASEVGRGRSVLRPSRWSRVAMDEDEDEDENEHWSRLVWTVGCALYIAHVVAAFHYDYRWSHTVAYTETARQTEALVGLGWGVGIFVNYLFTLVWVGETAWWWLAPATYRSRPPWIGSAARSVFFFMIINGAVVFVAGPMRWVGAALAVTLALTWWTLSRRPSPAANR